MWLSEYNRKKEAEIRAKMEDESTSIMYDAAKYLFEIGVYTKGDLKWLESTPEWKALRLKKLQKDADVAQKKYEEAKNSLV